MEDWKEALDNSNVVGILSTDPSKAFDSLHPPLLLAKLKAYGFEDKYIVQLVLWGHISLRDGIELG